MMKKFLVVFLMLVSGYAMAQPANYVPYASRNRYIALMADSTFHIPRFNGAPSLRTGGSTNDGALAADTANGRLYMYYNGSWSLINKDTANSFISSIYRKSGTDSVFYIKGSTHTFAFKDSTGGAGTWGSITGTLSSQTDLMDSLNARLRTAQSIPFDTTGAVTNYELYIDRTGGDTIKTRAATGGSGSGAFSKLEWFTGDENAPAVGDSILVHDSFPGKYLDVYRNGIKQPHIVNDTGFYRLTDSSFKVKPYFAANEFWHIEARDSTAYTQLVLQAPAAPPSTTIAYVNSADGGNNAGSGTTRTFSYTASSGSNTCLFVGFVGDVFAGADDVSSVTYNGVSMTLVGKAAISGGRWNYLYYLLNPASGAHNVVITCASSHWIMAGAAEYSGVQGVDTYTTNTVVGSSLTTTLTTGVDNCWTVLFSGNNGVSQSAGSGTTERVEAANNYWTIFDSNGPKTPAGSTSLIATQSAGAYIGHIMVSIKPY